MTASTPGERREHLDNVTCGDRYVVELVTLHRAVTEQHRRDREYLGEPDVVGVQPTSGVEGLANRRDVLDVVFGPAGGGPGGCPVTDRHREAAHVCRRLTAGRTRPEIVHVRYSGSKRWGPGDEPRASRAFGPAGRRRR